jgi:hypothetical protein
MEAYSLWAGLGSNFPWQLYLYQGFAPDIPGVYIERTNCGVKLYRPALLLPHHTVHLLVYNKQLLHALNPFHLFVEHPNYYQ